MEQVGRRRASPRRSGRIQKRGDIPSIASHRGRECPHR
jgi:hypothetical protein